MELTCPLQLRVSQIVILIRRRRDRDGDRQVQGGGAARGCWLLVLSSVAIYFIGFNFSWIMKETESARYIFNQLHFQENGGQPQQVSMESPAEHSNYSYQHSKWSKKVGSIFTAFTPCRSQGHSKHFTCWVWGGRRLSSTAGRAGRNGTIQLGDQGGD